MDAGFDFGTLSKDKNKQAAFAEEPEVPNGERSAEAPRPKKKPKKENPNAKAKPCTVIECSVDQYTNFPHCGPHHRAKMSIQSDIFPTGKKAVADKAAQEEFLKIFGDKKKGAKGDAVKMSKVLAEFLAEFPDGESTNGSKRCPSGWLSRYMKRSGSRKSTGNTQQDPVLDWDLFYTRVTAARPRYTEQDKILVWTEAEKVCKAEDKKYTPRGDLRIPIPCWVFGDEFKERKHEDFEEEVHEKDQNLSEEDAQKQLAELKARGDEPGLPGLPSSAAQPSKVPPAPGTRGSAIILAAPVSASPLANPLHPQTPTKRSAATILKANAVGDAADPANAEAGAAADDGQTAAEQKVDSAKKKRKIDIGVRRSQVMNAEKKTLDVKKKKVERLIDEAAVEFDLAIQAGMKPDAPEFTMTLTRWECALAWLGREKVEDAVVPEPASGPQKKTKFTKIGTVSTLKVADFREVDFGEQRGKVDEKERATFSSDEDMNDKILQDKLESLEVKVVKAADSASLISQSVIIQKIATAQSDEEIERFVKDLHDKTALMVEFGEAMSDSRKALKTAHAQITSGHATEKKKLENEQKTVFKKQNVEALAALKRRKSKLQYQDLFSMDWSAAGHPMISYYATKDAVDKAWTEKSGDMLNQPYVVQLESAAKIFTDDTAMKKSASDFQGQFHKHKKALEEDMVGAPLTAGHGADLLKPIWQEAFQQKHNLQAELSRLSAVALKPWIIGYTTTCCHMDFDPEYLGTMKLWCCGKVKVLCFSSHSLRGSKIAAEGVDVKEAISGYFHGLKNMEANRKTASDLNLMVYHFSLDGATKPILVMPPGWFSMTCVVEDQNVVAIRVSQLPKSLSARHNLSASIYTEDDAKIIQPWILILLRAKNPEGPTRRPELIISVFQKRKHWYEGLTALRLSVVSVMQIRSKIQDRLSRRPFENILGS